MTLRSRLIRLEAPQGGPRKVAVCEFGGEPPVSYAGQTFADGIPLPAGLTPEAFGDWIEREHPEFMAIAVIDSDTPPNRD
jgi:hypothetical protein